MIQLKELKQNDESFEQYYRRIHDVLKNLEDENKKKNDAFNRLKLIVLNQIIEKFVNELNDRQLRIKLNYKYMIEISFETQSLYDVYLIAKEYSNRITSKKKTLKKEFEKKLSIVMQRQNIETVARFVMKNQSETYTQKSKSMSVDRIERYRSASQQHKKSESTIQKNIVEINIVDEFSSVLKQTSLKISKICTIVNITNIKFFEKSVACETSIYSFSHNISKFCHVQESTVHEFQFILQQKSYQTLKNYSISSFFSFSVSSSRISKS